MTDDPDALLAALLADPPADPDLVARIDALVAAWQRFGHEAAGAGAIAAAAAMLVTAPGAGWLLLAIAAALPVAWLGTTGPRPRAAWTA